MDELHGFRDLDTTGIGNGWRSDMRGIASAAAPGGGPDMGGLPGIVPATDPFYQNVVLLIRGGGQHGSTDIRDSSPRPKIITNNYLTITKGLGRGPQNSIQESFTGSGATKRPSIYFNQSIRGSFSSAAPHWMSAAVGDEGLMSGDFTFEAWLHSGNDSNLMYPMPDSMTPPGPTINSTWNQNREWWHWALLRENGYFYQLVNFIPQPNIFNNSAFLTFGRQRMDWRTVHFGYYPPTSRGYWDGHYGEIRITRDVARYSVAGAPKTWRYTKSAQSSSDQYNAEIPAAPGWANAQGNFVPKPHYVSWADALAQPTTAVTSISLTISVTELEDILIIAVGWGDAGGAITIDTPSGWAVLGDDSQGGDHLTLFWRLADGTEGTTSVTLTGGSSTMVGLAMSYRHADPAGPQGFAISGDAVAGNSFTRTGPTGVPLNALSVAFGCQHDGTSAQTPASVTGTGWDTAHDNANSTPRSWAGSATTSPTRGLVSGFNPTGTGSVANPTFNWPAAGNGTKHHGAVFHLPGRPFPLYG